MAPVSSAYTQVGQSLSCNFSKGKTRLFVNCSVNPIYKWDQHLMARRGASVVGIASCSLCVCV